MRKITLFALASLTVSSAMAIRPAQVGPELKSEQAVATRFVKQVAGQAVRAERKNVASRAEASLATYPTYLADGAFYLGLTQARRSYEGRFGFAPASGLMGFMSTEQADSYLWEWTNYLDNDVEESKSSTAEHLTIDLQPMMEFSAPTLTSTVTGATKSYNNGVDEYLAGGSPLFYGFYSGEDKTSPEASGMVGVTPCVFEPTGFGSTYEASITRGEEGFNANGVADAWNEVLTDEGGQPLYEDLKITGFAYKLPSAYMPYLLSGFYAWLSTNTTQETPITVNVYGYDEEGYLDRSVLLGKGETIIPAGVTDDMVFFELSAVNSLGLTTSSPIVVGEDGVWVSMTGVDAETVIEFTPVYNFGTEAPADTWRDQIYTTIYPRRAVIEMQGVDKATGKVEDMAYANPWVYGSDPVHFAREYAWYFLIDFPIVMNGMTGDANFAASIPAAGGEETLYIVSTEDIDQLYSDMTIDATASADWIKFEVGYDETNEASYVTVSADALPEGETGRYGEIKFTGYACDFTVTVTQGEAGINAVVANGNGVSEFYDLQGRKLNAAPAKGLYIERNGSAAATKLAR